MSARTLPLIAHVCATCAKTYTAAPEAVVTCSHADTFARLRPPTIATRQKETAPS